MKFAKIFLAKNKTFLFFFLLTNYFSVVQLVNWLVVFFLFNKSIALIAKKKGKKWDTYMTVNNSYICHLKSYTKSFKYSKKKMNVVCHFWKEINKHINSKINPLLDSQQIVFVNINDDDNYNNSKKIRAKKTKISNTDNIHQFFFSMHNRRLTTVIHIFNYLISFFFFRQQKFLNR